MERLAGNRGAVSGRGGSAGRRRRGCGELVWVSLPAAQRGELNLFEAGDVFNSSLTQGYPQESWRSKSLRNQSSATGKDAGTLMLEDISIPLPIASAAPQCKRLKPDPPMKADGEIAPSCDATSCIFIES